MPQLFSPLTLRGLTLPNRIVVAPMCQYSAVDGAPNDWHLVHLGALSHSGAAMLCIEGTAVTPEGRITPGDLGLWDDRTEEAFARLLESIRRHSNMAVALQIAHAGRKGSCSVPWKGGAQFALADGGWTNVAPSAVPHKDGERQPLALDRDGIARTIDAFAQTARRAARLGFDAIEIHGAHGYLIHEFLSLVSNKRDDEYGGGLDNRIRFALEVFEAVRAAFPHDKPVGVKISASDWLEGGWDLAQSVAYAKALKARGADWMTASSGGISQHQKIVESPGYQVPFADGIKSGAGIVTTAIGLITDPHPANDIVASGKADLIALARGMLYDPRWAWHAAAALGASVDAPPQYWRARPRGFENLFGEVKGPR